MTRPIHIVGIGGALRPDSTSEAALRWMMAALEQRGAQTTIFSSEALSFTLFNPAATEAADGPLLKYVEAVRDCDGLVISSPVYHGGPSGLLKNAIDHLQPLASDRRPYLTGRPVCCMAAGGGVPGAMATLSALRDNVHALRGWPTPMQVPINSSAKPFDISGACIDTKLERMLNAALDDLHGFVLGARQREVA